MKIYACAVSVLNEKGQIDVYPIALQANNRQEALGKSLDIAYKESPKEKGNYNHQVTVVEVPKSWITGE